ncbi:MAG: 2,3-bisphosphoglycerate-independent phosphoglycerate mutase [bacterium]|nr:2,3-bisphosphoglycerate-independent phosphoglycerate mutase [bacterium]
MQIKPVNPVVLVVLDGWGIAAPGPGNAISLANKPNWDNYYNTYPHTRLEASGEAVGLPKGEAGNSEVGHLNLGAGRIVYQELPRINQAIADGTFLSNQALQAAVKHAKDNQTTLHLMGLIGTGVVHSSMDHLYALLWLAKEAKIENLSLHLFTDGRDSPPNASLQLIGELENKLSSLGIGQISTIMGRYWAMDRDKHWERIKVAYQALTVGSGEKAPTAAAAIQNSYAKNITDEFVPPTVIQPGALAPKLIKEKDSLIFFNFRPDRPRQLTRAFVLPNFTEFERKKLNDLYFVAMTEYEKALPVSSIAFPHVKVNSPLASIVSFMNKRQLHIGETEKYAHVTYFFNGGQEDPFQMEDRVHIPSPHVATYDLKPEMSAAEITDYVNSKLREQSYEFIMINFANPDMVAHTGSIPATVKAIESVDKCLGKLIPTILGLGGGAVITADHGNAELMVNPTTGAADTEHTTNPVPAVIIAEQFGNMSSKQLLSGILADVGPTLLSLMGIAKPSTMTGRNLISQY